ncbi:MAG: type II toxin-antitoxin system RelE/ParE family toxin [Acidobacteria bacterium]|nr:type II toxin-antitoxin system RelE/ParE family toxin [Acidobacteriota bacterium]
MYQIRILREASRSLENLDKSVAHRIVRKINWLAENAEVVKPKGLRKNLSGLSKLREGDYRIFYRVIHEEKTVIIQFIGHRREVYKNK